MSKLAVLALVMLAVSRQASPPPSHPPTATKALEATKKSRLRLVVEPISMFVLCVGGFLLGWLVYPPADADAAVQGQLAVEGPGLIEDAQGWTAFKTLSWAETHDNAVQPQAEPSLSFPGAPFFYPPHESQLPALPSRTVRVRLVFGFHRALFNDAPIALHLDLPEKAEVALCRNLDPDGPHIDCGWQNRPKNDVISTVASSILIQLNERYFEIKGKVRRGTSSISVVVDVKGVDGLSFVTNRTRATVRVPLPVTSFYVNTTKPVEINKPYGMTLIAALPAGEKYSWSDRPVAQTHDTEIWTRSSQNIPNSWSSSETSTALITGIRDDVIRRDQQNEFLAGIIFGLAGAAVIGFIQSIFSALRERHQ